MKAPVDLRALVEALEADPRLAERFARVLAPHVFAVALTTAKRPTGTYSSRKGCGAPGLSEEENKRIARAIGVKRGRWHVYSADDLAKYEAERDAKPAPVARAWSPADAAEQAGLRVVGGRR